MAEAFKNLLDADTVHAARDHIAAKTGIWLFDRVDAADVPGFSRTELYRGDRALEAELASVLAGFQQLNRALSVASRVL